MSENEQEQTVPVKITEIADSYKYICGDKYAVHVVMTQPPEVTFGYCFRTAGKWFAASSIYAAIGWIVAAIIYQIAKAL